MSRVEELEAKVQQLQLENKILREHGYFESRYEELAARVLQLERGSRLSKEGTGLENAAGKALVKEEFKMTPVIFLKGLTIILAFACGIGGILFGLIVLVHAAVTRLAVVFSSAPSRY